jgi:probable FeS assembly SUF system protein SufT
MIAMQESTEKVLLRDCDAVRIPSGEPMRLAKGERVTITQALGGSYTVATSEGLARIRDADADALGMESTVRKGTVGAEAGGVRVEEGAVWEQLKTCYDPEIPVNIVDLGLVYDCSVVQPEGAVAQVAVKMTLTAPGCGMGPVIAKEAEDKIQAIPGVGEARVEVVWDPPWNQSMISEVGKMKLGLI